MIIWGKSPVFFVSLIRYQVCIIILCGFPVLPNKSYFSWWSNCAPLTTFIYEFLSAYWVVILSRIWANFHIFSFVYGTFLHWEISSYYFFLLTLQNLVLSHFLWESHSYFNSRVIPPYLKLQFYLWFYNFHLCIKIYLPVVFCLPQLLGAGLYLLPLMYTSFSPGRHVVGAH